MPIWKGLTINDDTLPMMQSKDFSYTIAIITILGLLLYGMQSWRFAHLQDTIGDEGAYLYKGYMFARGEYHPFQEYGFWTNKGPLAFLIPGYIQYWFGPGLREARYFAVLVSVLMVIGVWLGTLRLGGAKWAAAAVWAFALSSQQIMLYSEALSQGLTACMLVWMLVLVLGEDAPLWQVVAGSVISVLIVMTRQNLVVIPAMLVLYVFWQQGKKAGLWSLITCAVIFIGFHFYYWPNILQLWAPWMPDSLTPFLNDFRASMDYEKTYQTFRPSALAILQSFATGMYDNFLVFFGGVSALVLFPKREKWQSDSHFKMAVFLGVTFLILFVMHTLASLFIPYCVYCFSGYQMFYIPIGFFFVMIVLRNGLEDSKWRRIALLMTVLFFAAVLGLYYYPVWGDWVLDHIRLLRINRMVSAGEYLTVSLRDVLTQSFNILPAAQKRIASGAMGLLLGGVLWVIAWILHRTLLHATQKPGFVYSVVSIPLALVLLISFVSNLQAGGNCSTDYLSYYEQAGRSLAQIVPAGSQLYWRGSGKHLALMLYSEDIKIFPPQIHAGGGRVVGDTQQLPKMGMYNQELDTQWRNSADILVIWEQFMSTDVREFLQAENYVEIPYEMGELSRCEDALYVFRRTQ
jgi:hypothetical protein